MERGCSWGCLNCSAHAPPMGQDAGEQRGLGVSVGLSHWSPAAGQHVESLAGKGVCWGRTVDGNCLGGQQLGS